MSQPKFEYMPLKIQNVMRLGGTIETNDAEQALTRLVGGLNALGGDGWQLVSMNPGIDMLIFMRQVPEQPQVVLTDP